MPEPQDHGPLPLLLVGLTVTTGLVDAFSYLTLGRVFVANMTGNVLFAGFALTGLGGISVPATLLALAAFAVGAALGGRWALRRRPHRGRLLAEAVLMQGLFLSAAAIVASTGDVQRSTTRLTLIALLALAMGLQNAVVRRLAVPDLTTTVLTMTITGLAADAVTPGAARVRRLAGLVAMFVGAIAGGALLRWSGVSAPLWVASGAMVSLAVSAFGLVRRPTAERWAGR
jgi:uncharacterized membrane protein YoaK (UPF0700 family)